MVLSPEGRYPPFCAERRFTFAACSLLREEAQGHGGWKFGVKIGSWPRWMLRVGGVGAV